MGEGLGSLSMLSYLIMYDMLSALLNTLLLGLYAGRQGMRAHRAVMLCVWLALRCVCACRPCVCRPAYAMPILFDREQAWHGIHPVTD